MSERGRLDRYVPVVAFLSEVCGQNYEVILHDVADPEHSVVAIFNGHLSGRKLGDPMTSLALGLLEDKVYEGRDFIANYEGRTRDGKRFVSSTYFIKENGEVVGLICVNHDVSDLCAIQHHMGRLLQAFSMLDVTEERGEGFTEELDGSINQLSSSLIHNTMAGQRIPPARMTAEERLEVIRSLEHQGVFATKGSVGEVAAQMGISEPTVYRYLRQVRKEK